MTQGVQANVSVRVQASLVEPPPVGEADQNVNEFVALALAAGVGIGNSDTLFTADLDIAASGNITVDLNGAASHDAFGNDIAMADVQAIFVTADATNANNIVIGNNASTPFLGPLAGDGNVTISVKPGGSVLIADPAGWPTNSSTAHLLKVANGGSGSVVTGKLVVIGRSA